MNKRSICINLIIAFILIGISVSGCNKSAVQNNSNQSNDLRSKENNEPKPKINDVGLTAPVPFCNPEKVNRVNFEKIKNGMTDDEISDLFDGFGEQLTTVEDYEQGKEFVRYDAPEGKGKILITFQNGKVSEKKAIDLN